MSQNGLESHRYPRFAVTFTTRSRNAASGSAPLFITCSVSRAVISARRNSCGCTSRAHAAWFFTRQSGCLSAAAIPPPCPRAAGCAHETADARDAHGEQRMGRYRLHALQVEQALRRVACCERVRELQGLTSAVRLTSDRTSCSPDRRGAGMGKGNLLDFGIKMNGILAHQVHKSDGGTFRKRDPVANRHGAYQFRQVAGLRRGRSRSPRFCRALQPLYTGGCSSQASRRRGEHGGLARRIQIADDRFRIGLLQLIGLANLHQADGRCKRNGIARVDHIVASEFSPFEHVGVER